MSDRDLWTPHREGGWAALDNDGTRCVARVIAEPGGIAWRAHVFGPEGEGAWELFATGASGEANIRAAMNWAVTRLAELGWYPDAERCDAQNAKAENLGNVSMVAAALRSMGNDEMQLMIDPSSGSAQNRTVCDRLVARGLFVWRDRGGATERLVRTPLGRAVTDALVAAERFEYLFMPRPFGTSTRR